MDSPSPGVVDPKKVKRNSSARSGDVLILGKPLGVGIFSAAFKKGLLDEAGYRAMIDTTTQLNLPGMELANLAGVHAMTDVTGFGLLGSFARDVPRQRTRRADHGRKAAPAARRAGAGAFRHRHRGFRSQLAVLRQRCAACAASRCPLQAILTDPQTSGGLLVACDPDELPEVQAIFARLGFAQAAVIGRMSEGDPQVRVE